MKLYKRITELGLSVYRYENNGDWLLARDLEALLKNGVEVTGVCQTGVDEPQLITFSNHRSSATHTALLINIQRIEAPKPMNKAELIKKLRLTALRLDGTDMGMEFNELADQIEQSGVSDE